VIGLFSTNWKFPELILGSNVNTSSNIENRTVFVAVAGDPTEDAVTTKSVRGVTLSGTPVITPLTNDSPVPDKAGADNVTGRPDVDVATNLISEG
jgi:hypothetical protein